MWTEIFTRFFPGQVSFVVHVYLLCGEALAAICVGLGIIWESAEYGASIHRVARRFLLGGIFAAVAFSLLLFAFDEGIASAQREEIIALETRLAARTLSDKQVAEIVETLRPFAGQEFWAIPYWDNPESSAISDRVARALTSAGWKIDPPPRGATIVGVATGVFVNVDPSAPGNGLDAAKALVAALKAHDIEATLRENPTATAAQIVLTFGIKP